MTSPITIAETHPRVDEFLKEWCNNPTKSNRTLGGPKPRMTIEEAIDQHYGLDRRVTSPLKSNKIGRNAPCPCGLGKKYKKCCLT